MIANEPDFLDLVVRPNGLDGLLSPEQRRINQAKEVSKWLADRVARQEEKERRIREAEELERRNQAIFDRLKAGYRGSDAFGD